MSRLTRWWRRRGRARAEERRLRLLLPSPNDPSVDPEGVPIPPPLLRVRIAGGAALHLYLDVGRRIAKDVISRFREAGVDPEGLGRLIDFGCGCGRVFRGLPRWIPNAALLGLDVDAEAVAWCKQSLASMGSFEVIPHHPPTAVRDGACDSMVAISVFTHLPPEMQRAWMAEWARLIVPGGHLLFSVTHESERRRHDGLISLVSEQDGSWYYRLGPQEGQPDWYQVTYHSEDAARRLAAPYFDVLRIKRRGIIGHQMSVVCRRRS